ncbi:hypothetical protein H310_10346 [Aphanomyces invadans]|uniref:Uncharacterized protein n=1 Tax=Aphanomyces invadans TaxID=157072 RepID=A0A024TR90_9STRA|nr:hypothetical protein H310_10346 [Aphanomyces invadans]ETV96670.1 hypothetical protein H310_10346 [Aphanomyces invadans]|eukprot:XP_008874933.1 hypothetical protein H310_10346 [Aphanomyces invadans]
MRLPLLDAEDGLQHAPSRVPLSLASASRLRMVQRLARAKRSRLSRRPTMPSPWTIAVKAARVAQMHLHHSLVQEPGQMALRRLLRLLAQHEWPRQHLVPRIALLPPPVEIMLTTSAYTTKKVRQFYLA